MQSVEKVVKNLRRGVEMHEISLGSTCTGDDDVRLIAEAMEMSSTVTTLDFSNNKIGCQGVLHVVEMLRKNSILSSIDLRGNCIGDEGVKILAEVLEENRSVTSLDLRRNKIGDAGAAHVASMLQKNNIIVSLDLRHNDIKPEGVEAIAGALESSGNTTDINLMYSTSQVCIDRLRAALDANKNRQLILTLHCSSSGDGAVDIVCTSLSGKEIAKQRILVTDTLQMLKATLAKTLQFPAQQLQVVLPDGTLLEDPTGSVPLGKLLEGTL